MRRAISVLLSAAALALGAPSFAQQDRPPKLEPLPEAPPPPQIQDGAEDARVRITPQQGDKVEVVRDGGRVVLMKVTPPNGIPYYLQDPVGSGHWVRTETLDPGVRVPMWTIMTFD